MTVLVTPASKSMVRSKMEFPDSSLELCCMLSVLIVCLNENKSVYIITDPYLYMILTLSCQRGA